MTRAQPTGGRLIIVGGLPGAGKTTLSSRLERECPGIRLSPDEWMDELDLDPWDDDARDRIERLQWGVAQRLLELRQTVIIEWGTWGRAERDALREGARAIGAAVELRFLDAPTEVLWSRVQHRDMRVDRDRRPLTAQDLDAYAQLVEPPDRDELALFDPPSGEGEPGERVTTRSR